MKTRMKQTVSMLLAAGIISQQPAPRILQNPCGM